MNTQTFLNTLTEHPNKNLLFEYAPTKFVGANYHITEVKHLNIESIDCGARTDHWKETIIQLWESPKELGKRDFMKVGKAMEIFDRVGAKKPFNSSATLKVEYGNSNFHTTQQFIESIVVDRDDLIVKLTLDETKCKANDLCGVDGKQKEDLEASTCCAPAAGCC